MPGARKLCYSLKKAGWKLIAVSGGFTIITDKLKEELCLDKIFSNELIFIDGRLDGVKINVSSDKGMVVKSIIQEWGIKKQDIVVVVDGANDLKLFDIAGYTVGFCPVEIVKQRADTTIEIRDLSILLSLLEKKFGKTIETQL
jgi:phosphoserine phosphatase